MLNLLPRYRLETINKIPIQEFPVNNEKQSLGKICSYKYMCPLTRHEWNGVTPKSRFVFTDKEAINSSN